MKTQKTLFFIGHPGGSGNNNSLYLSMITSFKSHFTTPTEFMLWHKNDRTFTKELHLAEIEALQKADIVVVDMSNPHIHSGIVLAKAIQLQNKSFYLLHSMNTIDDVDSSPFLVHNGANIPRNRWLKHTSNGEAMLLVEKIILLEKHIIELNLPKLLFDFLMSHKLYSLGQVLNLNETQWKELKPNRKINEFMAKLLEQHDLNEMIMHQ